LAWRVLLFHFQFCSECSFGADISAKDEVEGTLLMVATSENTNTEAFSFLIKVGADGSAKNDS
jgi:ankyrin repeat protein